MEDEVLNWTRSFDMGERETTVIDPTILLIGSGSENIGRDLAVGHRDLESRVTGLCTNMAPPPIPPWLKNSPERLQLLISNCSCWKKYTGEELTSSSRTRIGDLHSNDETDESVSRLLPFLAAITVGMLMIGFVALAYFWHQRKRRQFSYTAKYLKESPSRDYCSPNLYLTPSVTVETQLSLCALEDNFRIRPYNIYKEEAWSDMTEATPTLLTDSSVYENLSSVSHHHDNEVLLKPGQLEDNSGCPVYTTQTSYGDSFYSTHSLPVECVKDTQDKENPSRRKDSRHKNKTKLKQRPCPTSQEPKSLYGEIQCIHNFPDSTYDERNSSLPVHQNAPSIQTPHFTQRQSVMKKYRAARDRVLDKLPWKNSSKPFNQFTSDNRRFQRPIDALRQSLKGLRSFNHRRPHQRLDNAATLQDTSGPNNS